ncbi:MAG: alpha/beta hydrolase, partial [Pseudomonadota bacterium]
QVRLPTLVLYGDNETIVPEAPVRALVGELQESGRPVTLAFYPDGYHMLLRDLAADVPIADIAAWTLDRTAPLPSGADVRPPFWEQDDAEP